MNHLYFVLLTHHLWLCIRKPNIYSFMCSCFHGHSSLDLFIVFDAMNRHQRVPDDEAICPCLLCPGVRPLCPHYFVWVSGSSRHTTPHFKYFFSFFCFNYWPTRFNSKLHGSASTNKRTMGSWTFHFKRPVGAFDVYWTFPRQFTYSVRVSSRWYFHQ